VIAAGVPPRKCETTRMRMFVGALLAWEVIG